ncbi:hypothetical protein ACFQYP_21010 [Nonomuraea antimicrobica]|uniref:hypothetical protein n=1 Tax=Nonomuraea antimicrobica TaxID=561173 RepID=UPI0031EDA035
MGPLVKDGRGREPGASNRTAPPPSRPPIQVIPPVRVAARPPPDESAIVSPVPSSNLHQPFGAGSGAGATASPPTK